jgi:hypothetical protein
MCCFYQTSNTINLVTATKYTAFGVMEYCVFVKDLVDCSATTHGVIFAKYVAQITKQQGRYAVGHGLSPLVIRSRGRKSASLSRCTHPRKVAARRGVLIVQIIDYRNQSGDYATLRGLFAL